MQRQAWLVGFVLLLPFLCHAQEISQKRKEKTRILFIVDGSNSMLSEWEDDLKIDIAKSILNELVDSLRVNKDLTLALRIYGHRYDLDNRNCEDSKLEVPFGPDNHDAIIEKMRTLEPKGTTPIAYSLMQAADDFGSHDNHRNILIIITDGVESCGGDPCQVSRQLLSREVYLQPFVIGLSMDTNLSKDLSCLGRYFDAREIDDFREALTVAIRQSLAPTTVSVELLDDRGNPTETNVNMTFRNQLTGRSEYEFVHYRDRRGRTDSIDIEPVIIYDVIANTIPPVRKDSIALIGGTHNVIELATPQGHLDVDLENDSRYGYGVEILVREDGKKEILHVQHIRETGKYLTGTYDIEVLTVPSTHFQNVKINYKETTQLSIDAPGILNIHSPSHIFATIYKLGSKGSEEWVMNLETKNTTTKLAMQSGSYKIAYRSKNTFGSKFTDVKRFKITSKTATSLKLFE